MKRIRPTIKFSALLLLVLTLYTFAHSFVLSKFESTSFTKKVVCTATLLANDTAEQTPMGDCKPPKHSFIDYSTLLSQNYLILAYNPNVSKLLTHEPLQTQLQVYLEIIVPPDSLA